MDVEDQLARFVLDPRQFIGIPIALLGAVLLALGAQLQHGGVARVEQSTRKSRGRGLAIGQLMLLFSRPGWVIGGGLLVVATGLQLLALYFSPLTVVQPLGAIALVLTTVLNARLAHVTLNRNTLVAVALCVGSIFVFVGTAAFTTVDNVVTTRALVTVLVILVVVCSAVVIGWLYLRRRMTALWYILATGVLNGFVVTLAKVVIGRFSSGRIDLLLVAVLIGIAVAGGLGMYFVQNAYASGPPDLVIAGLSVIDPLVAVLIGMTVLGEAAFTPVWAFVVFIAAGGAAVRGVLMLAKFHPQMPRIRRVPKARSANSE